jgi:hypothetical protein
MTAGSAARAILRPVVALAALVVLVAATPVAGVLMIVAWQEYHPASLRAVVYKVSALTEAEGVDGVMDNLVAAFDRPGGHPG